MFGTDFSMIAQSFPNRNRSQIKNKYLREEKENPKKIEEAINKTCFLDTGEKLEKLNKIMYEDNESGNIDDEIFKHIKIRKISNSSESNEIIHNNIVEKIREEIDFFNKKKKNKL